MKSLRAFAATVSVSCSRHWPVVLGGAFLLVYGLVGSAWLQRGLLSCQNVLFDADVVRVTDDISRWRAPHWRSSVHPLFPLMMLPLGVPAAQLAPPEAVALSLVVLAGACAVGLIGATLRTLLPDRDALLLTVLYASSAASMFMFSIVDTFAFAALGIAATCHRARRRSGSSPFWIALFTFGTLITNIVYVVLAPLLEPHGTWRTRALKGSFLGLVTGAAAAVLAVLQWLIVPKTQHFMLPMSLLRERRHVAGVSGVGGVVSRFEGAVRGFFAHAFVAPEPQFGRRPGFGVDWVRFGDPVLPASYSGARGLLVMIVIGLLSWASIVNLSRRWPPPEAAAVGIILALHLVLMALYGQEPLLYSPLWSLSMILWLALALGRCRELGWRAPPRWFVGATALLVLFSNVMVITTIAHHYDAALPCAWQDRECVVAFYRGHRGS